MDKLEKIRDFVEEALNDCNLVESQEGLTENGVGQMIILRIIKGLL
jgi:hypothetical protein